ncbi:hypothetical protein NPIL_100401 [Nephila pilipes]|uniref:Uncharacterized protein n=1 Tax=Nephila pilipes TaxID=299642 RepID=A0A8X6MPB4_NEPPI|nr:hypothetical protein NPIL_100401 [Nephila pilipes]
MNFALFFGGLSVLIGSCLIVCVCNQCKRRKMRQGGQQRKIPKGAPSISYIIDTDSKSQSNFSPLKSTEFSLPTPRQFSPINGSSKNPMSSSTDSTDSTKSLLSNKDSVSSSSCLVLPALAEDRVKRSSTHPIIPTIYINSTVATSLA